MARTGSVVCPGCGRLVGVGERSCPFCGRPAPAMFGLTPWLRKLGVGMGLWPIVAGGCVALYVAALALDPRGVLGGSGGLLGILAPTQVALFKLGASGAAPVFEYHRWWTVFAAGWLHANLLHIGMNLLWVRQLAPAVERLYGVGRSLLIYVLSGVTGFLFSAGSAFAPGIFRMVLGGGPGSVSVGASAALFGLLGALIHFSRRGGSSALGQQVWTWAIALFVFGIIFPGVDNWAHLGGFLGGWALSFWLDPLREERLDHLVAAILSLVASAAAVVWSLLAPLS